jgi:predicted metalloprotease with PDZ domain
MLKLDNNLLDELGLGSLPEDQKKAMLQHIYETLELRVGTQLANQMTDQQLEEFEKFIDEGGEGSQAQALQWLETNLPHYKQVVNEVFEALKAEIAQMAPQIVAASAQPPQVDPGQQAA